MCFWDNSDNKALLNIHFLPLLPFLVPLICLASNLAIIHSCFMLSSKCLLMSWENICSSGLKSDHPFLFLSQQNPSTGQIIIFYYFSSNYGNTLPFINLYVLWSPELETEVFFFLINACSTFLPSLNVCYHPVCEVSLTVIACHIWKIG